MQYLNSFHNLYPVSKTLRFELKPIGKTLENIEKNGLIENDQQLADDYLKVKKIIDEYHKKHIENALKDFNLKVKSDNSLDSLEEFFYFYMQNNKQNKRANNLNKIQDNLRKQISIKLTQNDVYKNIFSKNLIANDLLNFVKDDKEKDLIKKFNNFTTYFVGFHKNRKNMYSSDEKSTSIAYRLINENLPRFVDNSLSFDKIKKSEVASNFAKIYNNFSEYLNINSIEELFFPDYFNVVLTQQQIDLYNAIIGGKSLDNGEKIQGLNEYINLYNQKQKNRKDRLPKLKPLYKQILSDTNSISWIPEEFLSDNEMLESIKKCHNDLISYLVGDKHEGLTSLKQLLLNLKSYDLYKIYIKNDNQLKKISQSIFNNWSEIHYAIEKDFIDKNSMKIKTKTFEKEKEKFIKSSDSFSIGYINDCLEKFDIYNGIKIEDYFINLGAKDDGLDLFTIIENEYANLYDLLNTQYPQNKNISEDRLNIEKIKRLLDAYKNLQFFIKPLLGKGNEINDDIFYSEFSILWDILDKTITPLYNKVRNYITRKPYSKEKIKLNFENSTLLNGWDIGKETDNTCVIFRKDDLYYLGIINIKYKNVLKEDIIKNNNIGECYEKMIYTLLPGPNKMLPKVFFSKKNIEYFNPSKQILNNYKRGTHKKGNNFNIQDCHDLINFFKDSISRHPKWKNYDFCFSETNTYNDISEFYKEVADQGYKIEFCNVSKSYIDELVRSGKLYLFQIYNKDFSKYSKGTPNMHTIYWKMLFDEQNLKDIVYKLNGEAEVFYRKKSINYSDDIMAKGHHYNELKDKFEYPIIKDRRYAFDKFLFHVPITMNFKSHGNGSINDSVRKYIKENDNINIIGIDRGERHLLYVTIIDLKGNIKEQFSLNEIINEYNGKKYNTNYHELLNKREGRRNEARKNWQTIEAIKELKEGYLSQVIHKLSQLIVEYNAIVVLEDLNYGFIRGRQKVEKQVYQKFEKMLIDKLNYLVDKQKAPCELGGALKALQLTNKFESFQRLGKQSGFLFYVPAWNTSKLDPTTGFVNLLNISYKNIDTSKVFFSKFDDISYNHDKDWFEFKLDYKNFTDKAKGTKTKWTICTYGTRIKTFRNPEKNNEWDYKEIKLNDELKKLFNNNNITYKDNLHNKILNQNNKDFFESLILLLRLTIQMRNSVSGTNIDYIISPVLNSNGEFFDSRINNNKLPINADANGAYNIARKGLWIIHQIKQAKDLNKINLSISNNEWLDFVQKHILKSF